MYTEYFHLTELPFSIAPDPRFLFMSARHREALAHLMYGLAGEGGFVLLTGEVGTGKTTICRCLLEQVPENCDIAFIVNPRLSAIEMLATVCDELHIEYGDAAQTQSTKTLVDRLNEHLLKANADGRKTVVIVDEAQQLDPDVLEQLRLLTNLETNTRKLLQIVLLGQPELLEMLERPELRQVAQRVVARYHLTHLNKLEVSAYVAHRLRVSGAKHALIPESLIGKLFKRTGGVPRLINVVCDRALLGAYVEGKQSVTPQILDNAAKEVLGAQQRGASVPARTAIAAGVAALAIGGVVWWAGHQHSDGARANGPVAPVAAVVPASQSVPASEPVPAAAPAVAAAPAGVPAPARPAVEEGEIFPPDSVTAEAAEAAAFASLFEEHGARYAPRGGIAGCKLAENFGLRCLNGRGNTEVFGQFDQPMLLTLRRGDASRRVLITGVAGAEGTFEVAGKKLRAPLSKLSGLWTGEYTLLWRPPPGYSRKLDPGSRSASVVWLRDALASATGERPEGVPNRYDDALKRQVAAFQESEGIPSDGVVGPRTLIRLAQKLDARAPRLHAAAGES